MNPTGGLIRDPVDQMDLQTIIMRDPTAFQSDPEEYLRSQGCILPNATSRAEVEKTAKERAEFIFSNWKTLRDILDRHEETIRKRWLKKGPQFRNKVLSTAWPKISAVHRPDWKAMLAAAYERGLNGPIQAPDAKYRDACLLPRLNLEDLGSGKAFLVLLNARARNAPDVFAFSDYQSVELGLQSKCINHTIIEGKGKYRMRLIAHTSPESYGSIYRVPETGTSPGAYASVGDVAPHVGNIILEIQDRTLNFLVKATYGILHDIELDKITGGAYPVQALLPTLVRENTSEAVTIPSLAEEGPYRVPHAMDFDALLTLIEAKRSECEDHMWSLREDPGYFEEHVISRGEHRQESVLDDRGEQHPSKYTNIFWNRILTNICQEAYSYLMSWAIAQNLVKHIAELDKKYAGALSLDKSLPADLETALLKYKEFIELMQGTPLLQLNSAVPGSPELRSDWIRDRHWYDPNVCKVSTKRPVLHDELLMLFTVLSDEERRKSLGLQNIMDEIERLIRRDVTQKKRISPMVAQMFADLSLTGELQRQLKLYQPRLFGPFYKPNPAVDHKAVRESFIEIMGSMMKVADHMDEMELASLGKPGEGRWTYPADEKPTQKKIDQMRLAEANLDKFWEHVDRTVLQRGGKTYIKGRTLHDLNPAITSKPRTIRRTGAWVEPQKAPKHAEKEKPTSTADLQFELELRTQRTIAADGKLETSLKRKTKTRGTVATSAHEHLEPPPIAPPGEQAFTLNKRAYRVFNTLYHSSGSSDQPGEIAWKDFMYAMTCVGFMVEKLYGSVWQFTPTKLDVECAINIHEPHPHPKIPFKVARRHGRRLGRAYGWTAGTFRLE